jgi:hypothetical protein
MPDSLMVIFSLGGALLARRLRSRSVRCRTAFVPLSGPPQVMISPWPGTEERTRGLMAEGQVRMVAADGSEVASRALSDVTDGAAIARADDLELLGFTATTLWTWVGLPLALFSPGVRTVDRGGGIVDVTLPDGWPGAGSRHRLHLDNEGRVVRHEEGRFVHHLSGHCVFGAADLGTAGAGSQRDVTVATRRRTTLGDRVTVLWADVVAAAVHPGVAT